MRNSHWIVGFLFIAGAIILGNYLGYLLIEKRNEMKALKAQVTAQ